MDSSDDEVQVVSHKLVPINGIGCQGQTPNTSADVAGPSTSNANGSLNSSPVGSATLGSVKCRSQETGLPIPIPNLQIIPTKNKFQTYSSQFIELLQAPPQWRADRIHYFQREAVLNAMIMSNGDNPRDILMPIVIVAPPGSGKTGMVVMLPYAIPSGLVMILTPSPIISNQIAESFGHFYDRKSFFEVAAVGPSEKIHDFLEPVTLVTGKLNPNERVGTGCIIINVQKFGGQSSTTLNPKYADINMLKAVEDLIARADLLIVDEAHHYPAETWKRIVDCARNAQHRDTKKRTVIFLSATFEKKDRTPILSDLQKNRIAYSVNLDQLQGKIVRTLRFEEERPLKDPKFRLPVTFITVAEDIKKYLALQAKAEPRFEHQAMVIVHTRAQAEAWTNSLNEAMDDPNFAIKIIWDKFSQKRTDDFSAGKYQVAVICNMLKEGYSNPKVSLGVILRKIGSTVLFDQFVGRCMRFNRDIEGNEQDRTEGLIVSYMDYEQEKMWEKRGQLAESDPIVEEEEIDELPVVPKRKSRKSHGVSQRTRRTRRN